MCKAAEQISAVAVGSIGPATAAVIGGVTGALAAALLGWIGYRWLHHKRTKSHWGALGAEVVLCKQFAEEYIDRRIASPLYRLPLQAFHNAFPVLVADGVISGKEVLAFEKFYNQVEQLNRGLDMVAEEASSNPNPTADPYQPTQWEEILYRRNFKKASDLVSPIVSDDGNTPEDSLYQVVANILDKKLERHNAGLSR